MPTYPVPRCLNCKRFHFDDTKRNVCDAFLTRIPDQIFVTGFDHSRPFPGDKGILYDPIKAEFP